jgi:protein dithiol oxidoreductase (disulfide-forming)
MNPLRRLVVAALAALPLVGLAQRPPYYELTPAQPGEAPGKIDVAEFFWYGCPHCYNLQPILEEWLKKRPPDVHFRRVPTVFNEQWAYDATIFYTFEALGVIERLHQPFFDAIHRERLRTRNWRALSEWLQRNGVDPKKFEETMKSFGVQSRTRRATQMTVAYRIEGTPALAVDGRYVVNPDAGFAGMLATVNQLIEKSRNK